MPADDYLEYLKRRSQMTQQGQATTMPSTGNFNTAMDLGRFNQRPGRSNIPADPMQTTGSQGGSYTQNGGMGGMGSRVTHNLSMEDLMQGDK